MFCLTCKTFCLSPHPLGSQPSFEILPQVHVTLHPKSPAFSCSVSWLSREGACAPDPVQRLVYSLWATEAVPRAPTLKCKSLCKLSLPAPLSLVVSLCLPGGPLHCTRPPNQALPPPAPSTGSFQRLVSKLLHPSPAHRGAPCSQRVVLLAEGSHSPEHLNRRGRGRLPRQTRSRQVSC